jgi:hypothetical protein
MALLTKWLALTVMKAIHYDVFFAALADDISACHAGSATDSDSCVCHSGP